VAKLDPDLLGLRVREFDDALEGRDLGVFPEAAVFGGYPTFGRYGGGFDEGEAWAAWWERFVSLVFCFGGCGKR
jgi:hypothetical protein